jgi:hypothetical protein
MDYDTMLNDSFVYAKDAIYGKWTQWFLLVIATILLCLPLLGYTLKVLRGEKPAPEVNDWVTLFIDGIRYLIVSVIYAIPALIVLVVTVGAGILALVGRNPAHIPAAIGGMFFGLLIFIIVALLTALIATIGIIRLARTGSMGEAFNFGEILATIRKIGWGTYIIALLIVVVVQIVFSVIIAVFAMIPVLGIIIQIAFIAPIALFEARYLSLLYDRAGPAPA